MFSAGFHSLSFSTVCTSGVPFIRSPLSNCAFFSLSVYYRSSSETDEGDTRLLGDYIGPTMLEGATATQPKPCTPRPGGFIPNPSRSEPSQKRRRTWGLTARTRRAQIRAQSALCSNIKRLTERNIVIIEQHFIGTACVDLIIFFSKLV